MELEKIFIEFINNLVSKTGNRHPVTLIELDGRLYEALEEEISAKLRYMVGTIPEPLKELRFHLSRGDVLIRKGQNGISSQLGSAEATGCEEGA